MMPSIVTSTRIPSLASAARRVGLEDVYGARLGEVCYEPAVKDFPEEKVWETYLDVAPKLFATPRDAFGLDVHLLHDGDHRLTPSEAGRLSRSPEDYRLFGLEDASPAELQESVRLIGTRPLRWRRRGVQQRVRSGSFPWRWNEHVVVRVAVGTPSASPPGCCGFTGGLWRRRTSSTVQPRTIC